MNNLFDTEFFLMLTFAVVFSLAIFEIRNYLKLKNKYGDKMEFKDKK